MVKRYELTEVQWQNVKEFYRGKEGDRGRSAVDNRIFINGVLCCAVAHSGVTCLSVIATGKATTSVLPVGQKTGICLIALLAKIMVIKL